MVMGRIAAQGTKAGRTGPVGSEGRGGKSSEGCAAGRHDAASMTDIDRIANPC
jgi:hypothetical protein